MAKPKKKLTPAQRAEKKRRKRETMIIFINGKQKRVRRPLTIDGMDAEEFIRHNADPIWLHQNERWDILHEREMEEQRMSGQTPTPSTREPKITDDSDDLPF
jgi:hypothetical protein